MMVWSGSALWRSARTLSFDDPTSLMIAVGLSEPDRFAAAPAIAGDVVILDSTIDAVTPGQMVPDTQAVTVPAGGSLTVILEDGETRVITGPYDGQIGLASAGDSTGLDALTASRGSDTKVLGAVRAPKWDVAD